MLVFWLIIRNYRSLYLNSLEINIEWFNKKSHNIFFFWSDISSLKINFFKNLIKIYSYFLFTVWYTKSIKDFHDCYGVWITTEWLLYCVQFTYILQIWHNIIKHPGPNAPLYYEDRKALPHTEIRLRLTRRLWLIEWVGIDSFAIYIYIMYGNFF